MRASENLDLNQAIIDMYPTLLPPYLIWDLFRFEDGSFLASLDGQEE